MTVTETFDPTTGCPGLGDWTVRFKAGTHSRLLGPYVAAANGTREGSVNNWMHDTLVITRGRVINPSRATLLTHALYSGEILRIRGEDGGTWTAWGRSILNWLGDDNGKGPAILQGTDYTDASKWTGSCATYLLALTVGGWVNGFTIDATAASLSTSALSVAIRNMDCARKRIDLVVTEAGGEYICNPNFSLTVAGAGGTEIYTQTPTVLFDPAIGFHRGTVTSWPCRLLPDWDGNSEASALNATNSAGTGTGAVSVGSGIFPNDTTGAGTGDRTAFIGSSDELVSQNWPSEQYRRTDSLDVKDIASTTLRQDVKPGDYVWLHDENWRIMDTANTLVHEGRTIRPLARRVTEMTWPVANDMGVYVLHQNSAYTGTNAVQDVTDEVVFDAPRTSLRVDTGAPRTLRRAVMGTQFQQRWDQK